MRIGLKLWSINETSINSAMDLFSQSVFDFIELFVVPGSVNILDKWSAVNIPFVLHAPHSYSGLNFSVKDQENINFSLIDEVNFYYKKLKPRYVIFHPGISGPIAESVRQILLAQRQYPDLMSIALIENKPMIGMHGERCVGYSLAELAFIIEQTKLGFCLDFGHAVCAAASQKKDWQSYIKELLSLKPNMFHLSDGHVASPQDEHLNIGYGDFDIDWMLSRVSSSEMVSLETQKKTLSNLDDFQEDCILIKRMVRQ